MLPRAPAISRKTRSQGPEVVLRTLPSSDDLDNKTEPRLLTHPPNLFFYKFFYLKETRLL